MSTYVDRTAGAVEYCEAAATQHPESAAFYNQIKDFLQQKLWHQLTQTLLEYFEKKQQQQQNNISNENTVALYDKVVLAVDNKLHPLSTARMAVSVAASLDDRTAAKAILENCLEKVKDNSKDDEDDDGAKIYLQSKHALLLLTSYLLQVPSFNKATADEETKKILQGILSTIETNEEIVKDLDASAGAAASEESSIVHAAHYETAMSYYKLLGPAQAFYEAALSYLGYCTTTIENTPHFRQLAVDLCLAALTGEHVYNLTVVAQHEILKLLESSNDDNEFQWLVEILRAVANGNILEFRQLSVTHAAAIPTQPALVHGSTVVQEKLTLTALVNYLLAKDAHERCVTFTELEQALHLQGGTVHQVEYVVMRAFSTGLLQGSMDQVDETVNVTYVQPRSLTVTQMQDLASKYADWSVRVQTNAESMKAQTAHSLLA